jgi:hypothetical protein
MTDAERKGRAVWKLEQGGYQIRRQQGRYLITNTEQAEEIEDLAQLVVFAEAVYDRVWTGRKITPSV